MKNNDDKKLSNRIEQSRLKQMDFNMGRINQNGFSSALPQSTIDDENFSDDLDSEEISEQSNINNSGFENNISGLFSNFVNHNNQKKKSNISLKAKLKIIGIVLGLFVLFLCVITVASVVMGQVMTVRDSIERLADKFTTGIEKFVNFAQGDGWTTNKVAFFDYLEEQYNDFEKLKSTGDSLDIPLIAATIHYSTTIDLNQYEQEEGNIDDNYIDKDKFEQLGGILTKDQTVSFYRVASEKVGSVSSIFPGQKRLLGHLSNVELEPGFYDYESSKAYWEDFFNSALNIVTNTGMDIKDETILGYAAHPITSFIALYQEMEFYLEEYGDITYGTKYDKANNIYELKEFLFKLSHAFDEAQKTNDGQSDDEGMFFSIKVTTSMNYGYDEYKQMKKDMLEMKSILSKNNVSLQTNEEILECAKNSNDTELKELYESYIENEKKYKYSYTHYLKELYIPFTYFYNQEYNELQIDTIVEEIYDQRDFYVYLVEGNKKKSGCGSTQAGDLAALSNEEFIEFLGPLARLDYSKTGVLASVTIAQAILETGWGNLTIPNSNNLFNIKCTSNWTNCVTIDTSEEYTEGVFTPIKADFRVYDSVEDSIEDHSKVLMAYAGLTDTADYREQVRILKDNNYATASHYDESLLTLIEQFNLTKWDTIVDVTDSRYTCVEGDYANWKQYDEQWADVPMTSEKVCNGGTSVCTIRNIGCLVTSLSIQIARSGVPVQNIEGEFNPGTFVTALRKMGSIYADGTFGGDVTRVAPDFKYVSQSTISSLNQIQKAQVIDDVINQGYYVIMEVRQGCANNGQHWVAIDKVEGDTVYMFDPGSPETILWKQYPHQCNSRILWYSAD